MEHKANVWGRIGLKRGIVDKACILYLAERCERCHLPCCCGNAPSRRSRETAPPSGQRLPRYAGAPKVAFVRLSSSTLCISQTMARRCPHESIFFHCMLSLGNAGGSPFTRGLAPADTHLQSSHKCLINENNMTLQGQCVEFVLC